MNVHWYPLALIPSDLMYSCLPVLFLGHAHADDVYLQGLVAHMKQERKYFTIYRLVQVVIRDVYDR